MSSARLFADRFLQGEANEVIDLASGRTVTLRPVTFADRAALHAWLQQCASRMDLAGTAASVAGEAGRFLPPLVDFGVTGTDQYFEAVAGEPRSSSTGAAKGERPSQAIADLLPRLAEVLDTGVSGRPRIIELAVPRHALERALCAVGRECRLRGYIPVNPARVQAVDPGRSLSRTLHPLLHGRHVVVLHEAGFASWDGAPRLFLSLGLDSDRPHVLDVLRPYPAWARCGTPRAQAGTVLRAREQQTGYAVIADAPGVASEAPHLHHAGWAAPRPDGDAARSRARIVTALESASRGRHANAARTLRDTLGMLTRREDLPGAGEAALALGRVLLTRGQAADAAACFEEARLHFDRAGLPSRAIAAAIFVGLAWTDTGRWLEAEAAIRAALIASATSGCAGAPVFGALALSRCLLWQGRWREAREALPDAHEPAAVGDRVAEAGPSAPYRPPRAFFSERLDDRGVAASLAARIAIASGDLRAAGLAGAQARERASLSGAPGDMAVACTAMAAVYAALGDVAALRPLVLEGVRAARLAHAPLRAIRIRALLADGLLRAGKGSEARPLLARLARLDLRHLPSVVRLPVERVLHWKAVPVDAAPRAGPASETDGHPAPEMVETLIEVVGLCQAIEDEEALLRKVMATLRARARAAVTGCFGLADDRMLPIAVEGREPAPLEVAERAGETGLAIAPGATLSGREAAVPVRAGGRVIGALSCRWAADVRPEWPVTGALFAAASASISPCLRALLDRRAAPAPTPDSGADEIIGASSALRALRQEIERAARAPFSVVIEGESGSGKELVARAIHRMGARRHRRLCAINCAAITDDLLEAELFGHARGAFTGAVAERKGLFEEADGGTLVLDEVGELTPRAQAKLLRAIQEGEVRRLGENFSRPVDARIIAASNRCLRAAVTAGAFRRDLLYRLEVIRIIVPPLRERVDDIPLLAVHFWQQATARLGSRATLAPATIAALARYDWPGNVRELQNVMAALAVSAGRRGSVGPEQLPSVIAGEAAQSRASTLDEARRVFEARFVKAALARAGGHRAQAAKDLGLTRQGLAKLVTRLGIKEAEHVG